jgi:hypothetical protein
MKSFAVAAFVAVAAAFPQYEAAPVNSTSVAYEPTSSSAGYGASTSSAEYQKTTFECSGPTEVPVAPGYTYTYTGSSSTTLTFSYPVATPPAGYLPTPIAPAPSAPAYPTSNGTAPAPAPPAGTAPGYTPGKPEPSEFPGAAGKTGLSMLAVAGALAAFL